MADFSEIDIKDCPKGSGEIGPCLPRLADGCCLFCDRQLPPWPEYHQQLAADRPIPYRLTTALELYERAKRVEGLLKGGAREGV